MELQSRGHNTSIEVFTIQWLHGINEKSIANECKFQNLGDLNAFQSNLHKRALEPQASKDTNT